MKMLKLYRGNIFGHFKSHSKTLRRFFLSDSFKCTEAWENRLKAPIFQKIQLGTLYAELDKCFMAGRAVNVLDVDIFVNGTVDSTYQNELEDVIHNLRLNPETSVMFESTSHAVIRAFILWNKKSDLLDILCQRLIYGVFPDPYLSILMMDAFLKESDVISAVKIAALQMLQEDCNHAILKELSLYSCVKYLNSSDVWITPKEEVDEDEEVVKIRVDYIRNEYYDDHFDITDTNHLVGKTMHLFGKTVDGPIGTSCQLIGLILHEKFDVVKNFVLDVMKNNLPIHKEAVEKSKSYLQNKPKQEDSKSEESNASVDGKEESRIKIEIANLFDELSNKNLLADSLETALEECVRKEVKLHEDNYILKQCEIYKKWEEERLKNCEIEINEEQKRLVKKEIDNIKQELKAEEQKLFYYDNDLEYDEIAEKKKLEIENITYYQVKKKIKPFPQQGYLPPKTRRHFR